MFPAQAIGKHPPNEAVDRPFFLCFLAGGIGAPSVTELRHDTPLTDGCIVTTLDWFSEVALGDASEDLGVS